MAAATLLYNGDVSDTAAIITAMSTNAGETMLVVPGANGQQVSIYLEGSP